MVVGAGPNGLAAAVELARHGLHVRVVERAERPGGGARTEPLPVEGFVRDVCSAVHPLAVGSPFLSALPLEAHGLSWVHSPAPLAHPLDGAPAAVLERSLDATAEGLGADGDAWRELVGGLVERWRALLPELLAPMHAPRHPLAMAAFGLKAVRSAEGVAARFRTPGARALLAGLSGHSFLPLERPPSAAVGVVLGAAAHAVGWPVPAGGSGAIADALVAHLASLGGEVVTGMEVESLDALPPSRAVLLDLTPRQVVAVAGARLPGRYRRRLERFRYGPGAFKLDYALDGPVPWSDPACARAATVHLGGTFEEVAAAERAPWEGRAAERPFVLLAQPSLFDPARAPAGKHVVWAYAHVPHGYRGDAAGAVEAQIERFAPGFRDRVLFRGAEGPPELEARNPNLVGGDINGGIQDLGQLLLRPVASLDPYATPVDGLYLCSASTPPGGGVHGMCGYHAARSALRRTFGIEPLALG